MLRTLALAAGIVGLSLYLFRDTPLTLSGDRPTLPPSAGQSIDRLNDAAKNGTVTEIRVLDGWTCPGPCGDRCRCADPKDCTAGTCPTTSPYPLPGSYEHALAAVASDPAKKFVVAVGVKGPPDSIPTGVPAGWVPGLYQLFHDGKRPAIRKGHMASVKVCHGTHCTTESVFVPD